MKKYIIILMFSIFMQSVLANSPESKISISGHIKDASNGEELIGATIYIKELKIRNITNTYGYYAISLPVGNYTVVYSFIGYKSFEKKINLQGDMTINVELESSSEEIEEVVVSGEKPNENIRIAEMSVQKMDQKTIKQIPSLMGEVDIIKAIQFLPGVQSTSEGSSGFSVRGGSTDQNLILLDEATVYNPDHLLGFFSVFNNDVIKGVKLYKGDIPASSGGRLSSLLDVRMRDGNAKKIAVSGGLGLISSRLTIEGPIIKDKTSFLVSGRRSYLDLFLPFAKEKSMKKSKLYFYDLNMKINHEINENNRIFLSGYFGRDHFKQPDFYLGFGNQTLTLRWNHLYSKRLFSNTTLIYSHFIYDLGTPEGKASSFIWKSALYDYAAKVDYTYYMNPNNTLKFGLSWTRHKLEPGKVNGLGEESFFKEVKLEEKRAYEDGIYVMNEQKVGTKLILKYGLRLSGFQNYGNSLEYLYDDNHVVYDSVQHTDWDFHNFHWGFEPRLGLNYVINESNSIKASYSRTNQYMQLARNSATGSSLDIWFTASSEVKPQIADQFALGFFKNFRNNTFETSVELYYKKMQNTIDFKDHANLFLNKKLEGDLRFGDSRAYGAEFLFKLKLKKLSGWISYTYSRTQRNIDEINNGKAFPAPYEKPHDLSVFVTYNLSKRWTFSANFAYATGSPITLPSARYEIQGAIAPVYTTRNEFKMPDYHRLDVSATWRAKPNPHRKYDWDLTFAFYNAYSRKNAWSINFEQDEDNPYRMKAMKTYLFPIIPSVTYNFNF